MSDLRGVLSLNEVISLQKESEWESTDNVWIFPDGGGPEFKFADGTVTPAPPATPLPKTKDFDYVMKALCVSESEGLGRAIVADPDPSSTVLAITSPEGVRVYNGDLDIYQEHGGFGDHGNIGFGSTGYTFIPRPVGVASTSWGFSVAVGEGKIAVGDRGTKRVENSNGTDPASWPTDTAGRVYVWDLDGSNQTIITPSSNEIGGQFGHSVGIGSGKIVVGAPAFQSTSDSSASTGSREGAVFIFNLDGTGENRLSIPSSEFDGGTYDIKRQNAHFGYSVCIHRGQIFAGAPSARDDGNNNWYRQGRVYQFDVSGTFKNRFVSYHYDHFPSSSRQSDVDDQEHFGMSISAADDALTDTNASFNLFVASPYASPGSSGRIYRFKIDANTGSFPPVIREESNGNPVYSSDIADDSGVSWYSDSGNTRLGTQMAWNSKSEGIYNHSSYGYAESSTTIGGSYFDFTYNGATYQSTYTSSNYYANAASSNIKTIPRKFTIILTGVSWVDSAAIAANRATIHNNVQIPIYDGTNSFTGQKCAINNDFTFIGTNSETQGAAGAGGAPFSASQPNGWGAGSSYATEELFGGDNLNVDGTYKGIVVLNNIYKSYQLSSNARKVLVEVTPIV